MVTVSKNMGRISYVEGDLLDFYAVGYIAHQCNCMTKHGKGLSLQIFSKYPAANIYEDGTVRNFGDVIVRGSIINMLAQMYPGKPSGPDGCDSDIIRRLAFKGCLDKMLEIIPGDQTISFPDHIGCGLAGGDWAEYAKMILEFSEKRPGDIFVVKKN